MPYANGDPTLDEQLEEDERRRFYTDDLLKDAREMQAGANKVIAGLKHALKDMKYRQTSSGNVPVHQGYAYIEVPDWLARQWLEALGEMSPNRETRTENSERPPG